MIEIVVRIVLAGVLGGAALAKLASPGSSQAALATFGFGEGADPARRLGLADRDRARPGGRASPPARRGRLRRRRADGDVRRAPGARRLLHGRRRARRAPASARARGWAWVAVARNLGAGRRLRGAALAAEREPQHRRVARRSASASALIACVGLGDRGARPGARGRDAAPPARPQSARSRSRARGRRSASAATSWRAPAGRDRALGLAVFTSPTAATSARRWSPSIEALGRDPRWTLARLRRGRRRRGLAQARIPGAPSRRPRPGRHRARQGHLQQPRPARERGRNRRRRRNEAAAMPGCLSTSTAAARDLGPHSRRPLAATPRAAASWPGSAGR